MNQNVELYSYWWWLECFTAIFFCTSAIYKRHAKFLIPIESWKCSLSGEANFFNAHNWDLPFTGVKAALTRVQLGWISNYLWLHIDPLVCQLYWCCKVVYGMNLLYCILYCYTTKVSLKIQHVISICISKIGRMPNSVLISD